MYSFVPDGLGWHRDLPDPRDYTPEHEDVSKILVNLRRQKVRPERVDWREYCCPIHDQGTLQTSSTHACAGLISYFERRAEGNIIEPSRMFIYRTARRLTSWTGDSGVGLRTTWKAIVRFGAPPEQHWPYAAETIDTEPDAFAYSFSKGFKSIRYFRLDGRGKRGDDVLNTVTSFLAAGFPCVFGFPVCTSMSNEADIPFPTVFDRVRGGQAVMAVGYDDGRRFRSERGALLVRSSWGRTWGKEGYGWLPYAYVRTELAADFWTLLEPQWLDSQEFKRPD